MYNVDILVRFPSRYECVWPLVHISPVLQNVVLAEQERLVHVVLNAGNFIPNIGMGWTPQLVQLLKIVALFFCWVGAATANQLKPKIVA